MKMSTFFRNLILSCSLMAGVFFAPAIGAFADTFDLPVDTVDGTYYESNVISGHCDNSASGWTYTSESVDSSLEYNVTTYLSAEYDLNYDDSVQYITYIYLDGSCIGIGTSPSGYYCAYRNQVDLKTIQDGVSDSNTVTVISQPNGANGPFYTAVDINTNGMYVAGFPEVVYGDMSQIYAPVGNVVYSTRVTLTDLSVSIYTAGSASGSDVDLSEVISLLNQLVNLTVLNNGNVSTLVSNSQSIIDLLEDLYENGVDINSNVLNIYNILVQYLPQINGNLVDIESDVETLHSDLTLTNDQIATIITILEHAYDTDSITTNSESVDSLNNSIDTVQETYISDIGTYLDEGDYSNYLSVSGDAIAPYLVGIVWFRTCLDSIYGILPSGIQYVLILILFIGAFLGILGIVGWFKGGGGNG